MYMCEVSELSNIDLSFWQIAQWVCINILPQFSITVKEITDDENLIITLNMKHSDQQNWG